MTGASAPFGTSLATTSGFGQTTPFGGGAIVTQPTGFGVGGQGGTTGTPYNPIIVRIFSLDSTILNDSTLLRSRKT